MGISQASAFIALALVASVVACEAIVGADFDPKTVRGSGGAGLGASTGGGTQAGGGGATGGGGGMSLLANGAPCQQSEACQSGYCVDELCCEAACSGECQSCANPGQEGTCIAEPLGSMCPVTANGTCDGTAFCVTGTTKWSRRIGAPDDQSAVSCGFRPDGKLWVAGNYVGPLPIEDTMETLATVFVSQRGLLLRFDPDGALDFVAPLGVDDPVSDSFEVAHLSVGPAGGVAIVGQLDGTISYGGGTVTKGPLAETAFLVALGPDGEYLWHHTYDGDNLSNLDDGGNLRVAHGPSGEIAVTVSFAGNANINDGRGPISAPNGTAAAFVAVHEPNGTVRWSDVIYGANEPIVLARDVAFLPDGDLITVGAFAKADLEIDGNVIPWVSPPNGFPTDVYLVVYDGATGDFERASKYGDDGGRQEPTGLAVGPNGNVLMVGFFASSIQFTTSVFSSGSGLLVDSFVAMLSQPDRSEVWPAIQIPLTELLGTTHNYAAVDRAGNSVFTGRGRTSLQVVNSTMTGTENPYYIQKIGQNGEPFWFHEMDVAGNMGPSPGRLRMADVATAPNGEVAICGFAIDDLLVDGTVASLASGERDMIVHVFNP
jgi:hypothetical protein